MKRLVVLAFFIFTFFPLFAQETSQTTDDSIGRFQLSNGTYQMLIETADGSAKGSNVDGVFKIDTLTGRTWRLFSGLATDKYTEEWREIPTKDGNDPLGIRSPAPIPPKNR